jgi:hypothetical protein
LRDYTPLRTAHFDCEVSFKFTRTGGVEGLNADCPIDPKTNQATDPETRQDVIRALSRLTAGSMTGADDLANVSGGRPWVLHVRAHAPS